MEQLEGFPFWTFAFTSKGQIARPQDAAAFLREFPAQNLSDLFIISHGWNNDEARARRLYERFLGQLRQLVDQYGAIGRHIGVVGLIWPSLRWRDEPIGARDTATDQAEGYASTADLINDLQVVFTDEDQRVALNELRSLFEREPDDLEAFQHAHDYIKKLAEQPDDPVQPEDQGEEQALLQSDPIEVFDRMERVSRARDSGGEAGLVDFRSRRWRGVRETARFVTYYTMKNRAGVVGQRGLGPMIGDISRLQPNLRIHLVGHSFGARLVSFALAGLPAPDSSPVKSMALIQGAFSHYTFANSLPHDPRRAGTLAGLHHRVDGPILVTHSKRDIMVGRRYLMASAPLNQDAALVEEAYDRWGAMGHDGARAVDASEQLLGYLNCSYRFQRGEFANLDGNETIMGHSDIFHPEIAWAILSAAGLVAPTS